MAIPQHRLSGLLPPFSGQPGQGVNRSPYLTNWPELVGRLGTSDHRKNLLKGLLEFRERMRQLGITSGQQWLTGSFVDVMTREPNDIDVVTFMDRPASLTDALVQTSPDVFDRANVKAALHLDTFFVVMNQTTPKNLVELSTYYYGLFSHTRLNFDWKGFVLLPLLPAAQDAVATALLA